MKSVLFVCLGNICRSPGAEAIFRKMITSEGLSDDIQCDSAGIIGAHAGEPADSRMINHGSLRGLKIESISRKFDPRADFDRFDYIIAMDETNETDLHRMSRNAADSEKIFRMTDFSTSQKYSEIPDPYYGGNAGFELVLDLLEDACENFLEFVKKEI
jgi:protein-tyrosine phosphatase